MIVFVKGVILLYSRGTTFFSIYLVKADSSLVEGDVGSENNLTKYTVNTKVEICLDNQDLMLPEPYIILWAGE